MIVKLIPLFSNNIFIKNNPIYIAYCRVEPNAFKAVSNFLRKFDFVFAISRKEHLTADARYKLHKSTIGICDVYIDPDQRWKRLFDIRIVSNENINSI